MLLSLYFDAYFFIFTDYTQKHNTGKIMIYFFGIAYMKWKMISKNLDASSIEYRTVMNALVCHSSNSYWRGSAKKCLG